MSAADDLAKYTLNCDTVGIALKRVSSVDDCFYNEFPIRLHGQDCLSKRAPMQSKMGEAATSDAIKELSRIPIEEKASAISVTESV